jgi:hypothetical protein
MAPLSLHTHHGTNLSLALPPNLYYLRTSSRRRIERPGNVAHLDCNRLASAPPFSAVLTKNAMPQRQDGADPSAEHPTLVAVPPVVHSPPRLVAIPIGETGAIKQSKPREPLWAKGARVGERGICEKAFFWLCSAPLPARPRRDGDDRFALRGGGRGRSLRRRRYAAALRRVPRRWPRSLLTALICSREILKSGDTSLVLAQCSGNVASAYVAGRTHDIEGINQCVLAIHKSELQHKAQLEQHV